MVECYENGDLFRGTLCFMFVGQREGVPIVDKTTPDWLADKFKDTINKLLQLV